MDLASYSPTVGSLSGASTGIITTTTVGTNTLYVNSAVASTYNGIITNGSATSMALVKQGTGTLTLASPATASPNTSGSTYTGGTTIAGGTIILGSNAANNSLSNLGTGRITFQGGALSTAQPAGTSMDFSNNIFIDAGQTGTITLPNRVKWGNYPHPVSDSQYGLVSGGGTLNLINTGTVNRVYLENNWNFTGTAANGDAITPFTGTLNISGSGSITMAPNAISGGDPHFNGGSWTNATVNIDNVLLQAKTNSGGNTMTIGSLSGTATATLGGDDGSGGTGGTSLTRSAD